MPGLPPHRPARTLRRVVAQVAATLAVALAAATLAGFAGAWWWIFDLVANLRTQLAVLLLVLTLVLARTGPRWAAITSALAVVANVALIVPFLPDSRPPPASHGGEALALTFLNVKVAGAAKDDVIDYLRARDDDVVILAATTREWVAALESADLGLAVVMGSNHVPLLELTVLARDPHTRVHVSQLTAEARSSLVTVFTEIDAQPVRILTSHPVSPLTPERAARRDAQLRWMADQVAATDDAVVVLGDLNATPWSWHFRSLLAETQLIDSQRAHGLQPSWPAAIGILGIPIDHVLHSPELTTIERRLGPSFGSTHRTVHVRVARGG